MKHATTAAILTLGALLAGCASLGAKPDNPAVEPTSQPANERAKLYAACVAQAASDPAKVEMVGHLIRLTCIGAPAQALYDSAKAFATDRKWEACSGYMGNCVRWFTPRSWDDQCAWWVSPQRYECRIHIPVGPFLRPEEDGPLVDKGVR